MTTDPVATAAYAAEHAADPIIAAIERHKEANRRYGDAANLTDEVVAKERGYAITQAEKDAFYTAEAEEDIALSALLETVPVNATGARAMLEYVIEIDWQGLQLTQLAQTLLRSPVLGAHCLQMNEEAS